MPRAIDEDLGRKVAARLDELGFSPERASIESDGRVSPSAIRDVIRGYMPRLSQFVGLAAALRTTVGALLGETDESPFIDELRSLEPRLDERGRDAILAVARSQANARAAELPAPARRAVEAAEGERDRIAAEEATTPPRRRVAESPPTELPKRGDAAR